MEFQYRAGDARSLSTGAAPTSANSESAATRVQDDNGGDGSGFHGESSESLAPRPVSGPDELRRQAMKERIRERILREEAERLTLEAEVWRELLEERRIPSLARPAGACASGSEARAAADWPSPETPIGYEDGSKPDVSATLQAKRKTHHVAAASNVSAATSNKKQKPDLTCTVCGITATSEGSMQAHLNGKTHNRKAAKLAPPLTGAGHHEVSSKVNGFVAWPAKGGNPNLAVASTVFAATSSNNEQKPDLTCTVCGVTSTSQKAMQGHLEGKLHRRKAARLSQPMPKKNVVTNMVVSKPNASEAALLPAKRKNSHDVVAASTISVAASSKRQKQDLTCTVCGITATGEKDMQTHLKGKAHMRKAAVLLQPPPEEAAEHGLQEEAEEEGTYTPKKFSLGTNNGNSCEVVQMNGFVLCEVCNVKTPDLITMRCHLEGDKHISKAKQQERLLETVDSEVNGVRRVDGFLLCELCDVKLASATVMHSHLSGKKHASKQKAAIDAGAGGKAVLAQAKTDKVVAVGTIVDTTVTPGQQAKKADAAATVGDSSKSVVLNIDGTGGTQGHCNDESMEKLAVQNMEVVPSATPQEDGAATVFSMAPMEVDEHAEAGDRAAKAEEEKLDAEEEEAGEINAIVAVSGGQEVKIQVEGKLFIVLRQADGSLSCGLCSLHGCDKGSMLEHLYTGEHWRRARLSEQKQQQAMKAAPARRS